MESSKTMAMMIPLDTFCEQFVVDEHAQGAAKAALAQYADDEKTLDEWRSLWLSALSRPV
jgi:hypothetical protein